jgi:hypothetical protein
VTELDPQAIPDNVRYIEERRRPQDTLEERINAMTDIELSLYITQVNRETDALIHRSIGLMSLRELLNAHLDARTGHRE